MPTTTHTFRTLLLASTTAFTLGFGWAAMADPPGTVPPPRGFTLHPLPPKDLDYESLSPSDLKALHLPADLAERPEFLRALRAPNAHSVDHVIGTMPGLQMGGLHVGGTIPHGVKAAHFNSTNWSGSFWFVSPYNQGAPSVSDPVPYPSSVSGGDDWLSVWTGMGGVTDDPLWQAGYVEDTNGSGLGGSGPTAITFAECFPAPIIGLFYTAPGHYVWSEVWSNEAGSGGVYVIDFSTGDVVFGSTPCAVYTPQTVEWIVEAPTVNGQIATLANYGSITLNSAQTSNYGGGDPNANWLTMVQNGRTASQCRPNDYSDLTCQAYP